MQTLTPGPEEGQGVWEAEEDTRETLTVSKQGAKESMTATVERKLLSKSVFVFYSVYLLYRQLFLILMQGNIS